MMFPTAGWSAKPYSINCELASLWGSVINIQYPDGSQVPCELLTSLFDVIWETWGNNVIVVFFHEFSCVIAKLRPAKVVRNRKYVIFSILMYVTNALKFYFIKNQKGAFSHRRRQTGSVPRTIKAINLNVPYHRKNSESIQNPTHYSFDCVPLASKIKYKTLPYLRINPK